MTWDGPYRVGWCNESMATVEDAEYHPAFTVHTQRPFLTGKDPVKIAERLVYLLNTEGWGDEPDEPTGDGQ